MTEREYNHCVKKYSDDLYRFALRYTGDGEESEDCVQDCFVTLWEKRETVDSDKAKGWLMRLLYHKLVDLHRHHVVEREAQKDMIPTETHLNRADKFELHDSIQTALNQLPEIQRQLVLLKDLEGYEYSEMAQITGLTEQQVGVYLFRARKTMRNILKNDII